MYDFLATPAPWHTAPAAKAPHELPSGTLSAAQRAREQAAGGQRLYRISDKLRLALRFFTIILKDREPRVMYPLSRARAAMVVHTDAEWSAYNGAHSSEPDPPGELHDCLEFSTGMGGLCLS